MYIYMVLLYVLRHDNKSLLCTIHFACNVVTDKNKTHSPGLPRKMNIQHKFQVPSSKFYYISHKI